MEVQCDAMDEMVKEENANKKDKKQRYLRRPRLRGKLESAHTQQYGNQQEEKDSRDRKRELHGRARFVNHMTQEVKSSMSSMREVQFNLKNRKHEPPISTGKNRERGVRLQTRIWTRN